ncbi:hypothetical protein CKO31_13130 [Thiohalocapsa halophila]|uniref:DUF4124 domain-containing protein n=1 Tax=Thiohalocapsa halophila TaxID=69359 RepID=A0ABS1CIC7_9GAMM|nr:DUF4124 domain-containing protein [Thiohalocapsa halophila]MBK1631671.1 hypothetical protein [Thiohalocapsa halophila]
MRTALLPAAAAALALACPALAGLNKCVDASGNVTYRQTACPGSDTAQEIATAPDPTAGRSAGAAACNAVRKLADVLTNHHVVDGCGSIRVQHGERWHDARLTHSRASTDLAILRVEDLKTQPAVFSSAEANLGETASAAGYPLQDMLSRQVNVTSGIVSANAGICEETTHSHRRLIPNRLGTRFQLIQHRRQRPPLGPAASGKSTLTNRFDIVSAASHSRLVPSALWQR